MSYGSKSFRAADLFTPDEFKRMADIVRLSLLDGKPAAPEIAEKVIAPIIDRIQVKIGASFDPMYLAYAAEDAIKHFLTTNETGVYATTPIPAVSFDTKGPVN